MEIFRLFGSVFLRDEEVRKKLEDIDQKAEQTSSTFNKLGNAASKFGSMAKTALIGVGTAVAGAGALVGKFGVDFNAKMEQSTIAWETLLGSAENAKEMLKDLQQLGAKTPFEFKGLDKSAKLLKAMGVDSKEIIPYLTNIGDAVSAIGGGQEELEGVSMAIGQMLTKGKVSAEEMNQLAERGIPAWELMAQKLGMSKQELMDLSSQGKIYAEQAIPALLAGMQDKFSGAMDKQSHTFNGQMSTLKDNIKMVIGEISGPIFEMLKAAMPQVIDSVDQLSVWVHTHMPEIKSGIESGVNTAISVFKAFIAVVGFCIDKSNILIPILAGVVAGFVAFKIVDTITKAMAVWKAITITATAAQTGLNAALRANPIGIVITAIGLLVAAGVTLYQNWDTVKSKANALWISMKEIFGNIKTFVTGVWNDIWSGIKWTINQISKGINTLIGGINKIDFDVPDWVPGIGGKKFGFDIPKIPMLAKGTDYFDGGLALVGEEGPELVNLPRGSKVIPNRESEAMLQQQQFPEYIQNTIYLDSRVIAEAISQPMYGRSQQRSRGRGILAT